MPFSVQLVILSLAEVCLESGAGKVPAGRVPMPPPHRSGPGCRGSSQPEALAGTKLKIHGPHGCEQRWQRLASLGSQGCHLRDIPPEVQELPECQPLLSVETISFLQLLPTQTATTCSFHSRPRHTHAHTRQGSRGTGPLGCILETSVCSEQAVLAPIRRGSQRPACIETIMSCGQILGPAYKAHLSVSRRPSSHRT